MSPSCIPRGRKLQSAIFLLVLLPALGCSGREPERSLMGHAASVKCIAYSADGTRIASADEQGTLILWDAAAGTLLNRIAPPIGTVTVETLAFSPDGKFLGTGFKGISLYNIQTGKIVRTIDSATPVRTLSFSDRNAQIAFGEDDGHIRVWNLDKGSEERAVKGHTGQVTAVSFGNSGDLLASGGSDQNLLLWAPTGDKPFRTLTVGAAVGTLALMSGGTILGGWLRDDSVRVWDASTGKERKRIPVGPCNCVAFTTDGSAVVCGSAGVGVRIIDLGTGKEIGIVSPGERAESLAVSPDSRHVAVGSASGQITIWKLKP